MRNAIFAAIGVSLMLALAPPSARAQSNPPPGSRDGGRHSENRSGRRLERRADTAQGDVEPAASARDFETCPPCADKLTPLICRRHARSSL